MTEIVLTKDEVVIKEKRDFTEEICRDFDIMSEVNLDAKKGILVKCNEPDGEIKTYIIGAYYPDEKPELAENGEYSETVKKCFQLLKDVDKSVIENQEKEISQEDLYEKLVLVYETRVNNLIADFKETEEYKKYNHLPMIPIDCDYGTALYFSLKNHCTLTRGKHTTLVDTWFILSTPSIPGLKETIGWIPNAVYFEAFPFIGISHYMKMNKEKEILKCIEIESSLSSNQEHSSEVGKRKYLLMDGYVCWCTPENVPSLEDIDNSIEECVRNVPRRRRFISNFIETAKETYKENGGDGTIPVTLLWDMVKACYPHQAEDIDQCNAVTLTGTAGLTFTRIPQYTLK